MIQWQNPKAEHFSMVFKDDERDQVWLLALKQILRWRKHFSDQLEKDFETSGSGLHDVRLDTPPDSDSENSEYLNQLLDDGIVGNEVDEQKDDFEAPGVNVTKLSFLCHPSGAPFS